ncbi:MAG: hypothetical protein O3A47_05490, partial [Chloroflexi bacterium]|nr:hypothetical protein [Chloroflexota bacterium]
LDTWIVRVFGLGDPASKRQSWLRLKATPGNSTRWSISKTQSAWPKEYATWTAILRYFVAYLNSHGKPCPHPAAFVESGLRSKGFWTPADVEIALWTYAKSTHS